MFEIIYPIICIVISIIALIIGIVVFASFKKKPKEKKPREKKPKEKKPKPEKPQKEKKPKQEKQKPEKPLDEDAIEQKAAGDWGEQETLERIKSIKKRGDYLIQNIPVSFNGEETELDILIVNHNGVFIIEVKYYHGELFGNETDEKWIEYKVFPTGEEEKFVKNPISQVKWQAGMLGKRLRSEGIQVWTEGFVYLVDENSPVKSRFVLNNVWQINKTIHTDSGKNYDDATVRRVVQWAKRQKR